MCSCVQSVLVIVMAPKGKPKGKAKGKAKAKTLKQYKDEDSRAARALAKRAKEARDDCLG